MVVIVLVILIILVTAILIFGGSVQRGDNSGIEKEIKIAEKEAIREIKEKERKIKNINNEYVDILKSSTKNVEEVEKIDENNLVKGIKQEEIVVNSEIEEDIADEEISEEDIIFSELISSENIASEEFPDNDITQESMVDEEIETTNIEEKSAEGLEKIQEIDNIDESEDVTFLFNDDKEDDVIDTLDMYIKEAQEKDIGYLNGDEPESKKKENNK